MGFIYNLKNKYYRYREKKIYGKFKNCTLPYPFHDDKRWTFEWVWYDKNSGYYNTWVQLSDALPKSGLIYHYEAKMIDLKTGKNELISEHAHSFDEVLRAMYEYPESFNILDKDKCEYSEQELELIKENQNYFKLIGLKDYQRSEEIGKLNAEYQRIDEKKHKNLKDLYFLFTYQRKFDKEREKENLIRYNNCNHQKYSEAYTRHWDNDVIEAAFSGKKKTVIRRKYSFNSSMVGMKYLLVDEDLEFRGLIEFVKEEIFKFDELNESMVYVPKRYKNFAEYKKALKKDYEEDGKIYNEKFDRDSEMICGYFKVIEKF